MLRSLSPQRRRFVMVVIAMVSITMVALMAVVLRSRPDPVTPVPQSQPGPVLLVPGYGGSTSALDVLASSLSDAGRDVTVVSLAGDGTGDLREQVEVMDEAVRATVSRTGAASVDVVGFSAGGVIAREWVANSGGGSVARRVVTLGSPQHGTDVATLAAAVTPSSCPTACEQLKPDSDLLRSLNAGDETPAGPVWVSMWSTSDQLVVPPESASLEGGVNFSVQSVCGPSEIEHGDLPRTPSVIALTMFALADAVPVTPTADDC
ncbi:MAG: alpha/beta fold hydrolase [Actinomycetia bacterium]|nr:alpha/beta fold hydrolase [Actinomycetes bacterium]